MLETVLTDDNYLTIASSTPAKLLGRYRTEFELVRDLKVLVERLGLSEDSPALRGYYGLRSEARTLCFRHLEISSTLKYQPDRVAVVLKHARSILISLAFVARHVAILINHLIQIHAKFPSLFGTSKDNCMQRLFLVRNLLVVLHGENRRTRRGKKSVSSLETQDYSSLKRTIGRTASVDKTPTATTVSPYRTFTRRRHSSTPQRAEDYDNGHTSSPPTTSAVITAQKPHMLPSASRRFVLSPPSSPIVTRSQSRTTFPSLFRSAIPMTASNRKGDNKTEPDSDQNAGTIAHGMLAFLSTCRPSMLHLSYFFFKYECTTEEHILRLATLENTIRYKRLKDMLPMGSTEMEIMFLEKHLDDYFDIGK